MDLNLGFLELEFHRLNNYTRILREQRPVRCLLVLEHQEQILALPEAAAGNKQNPVPIEGGPKANWAALETGLSDKDSFYYASKILGGLEPLSTAARRCHSHQLYRVAPHHSR